MPVTRRVSRISIEDEQTELPTRRLAEPTGEALADAIGKAVAERYERLHKAHSGRTLAAELTEIALRCASRQLVSKLSDDEILGYDQAGIPPR